MDSWRRWVKTTKNCCELVPNEREREKERSETQLLGHQHSIKTTPAAGLENLIFGQTLKIERILQKSMQMHRNSLVHLPILYL